MKIYIVIPAHNEEAHLGRTLDSLINQTYLPKRIVVVNDHSTDTTSDMLDAYTEKYDFISAVHATSSETHSPGSKVIAAFNKGLAILDDDYDIVCKFDADLEFPENYLEHISELFSKHSDCGMAAGYCYIESQGSWKLENLTSKDHIRGALKAYRKACFQQIGGLKASMGWDTIDELLAQYHGWRICTDESLHVKHLKPTGSGYTGKAAVLQGKAFKRMRYGFVLTLIATAKLAFRKKNVRYFIHCMKGYFQSGTDYLVSVEEGKFIRNLRWMNIRKKLF